MIIILQDQVTFVRSRADMVLGDLLSVLEQRRLHYNPQTTTFFVNGNRIGRSRIWSTPVDHFAVIEVRTETMRDIIGNVSNLTFVNMQD